MSLRLRLVAWYGLLLGLGLLAFAMLLYFVLRANLEQQLDETLRFRAAEIGRGLTPGPGGALESSSVGPEQLGAPSVYETVGPSVYAQVFDRRAQVIASSGGELPIDPEPVLAALEGRETLATLPLGGGRSIRLLTRPLEASRAAVGALQVGQTFDAVDATLRQVRDVLVASSLGILGLAGLGGLLVSGRALAPVRRVSATARRIATTGDYAQRVPADDSPGEIGELVATFNALIERVERSLEEQRQFLADTSHELRSPLTVVRADLGFLWRESDFDTRADCLREAEAEVARMSRLVADLLLLGQAEATDFLQPTPVRLDQLVAEVAEQARVQADGRTIEVDIPSDVTLQGDRDRLKQLLWNLVENALRYTDSDGTVRLALASGPRQVELCVADDGAGIGDEHLPRIFDRFYRVERARSRATGGSGLGLAIVQRIARAHGGEVSVESELGSGTTFRVSLPVERARSEDSRPAATAATAAAGLPSLRGNRL